jgi:hypothetical protein
LSLQASSPGQRFLVKEYGLNQLKKCCVDRLSRHALPDKEPVVWVFFYGSYSSRPDDPFFTSSALYVRRRSAVVAGAAREFTRRRRSRWEHKASAWKDIS